MYALSSGNNMNIEQIVSCIFCTFFVNNNYRAHRQKKKKEEEEKTHEKRLH